jgi:hypothetical protein
VKARTSDADRHLACDLARLRRAIPRLPARQLESLRRSLIDLLTEVSLEKTRRQQNALPHPRTQTSAIK